MKGNEKKKKEPRKAKSDIGTTKGQSDYQKEKTRHSIIEPLAIKPKK